LDWNVISKSGIIGQEFIVKKRVQTMPPGRNTVKLRCAAVLRFRLPCAPGGVGDITARIVAQKISDNIGQQVVVDNRPGAGMIISASADLR
jgi:hypothetical protein